MWAPAVPPPRARRGAASRAPPSPPAPGSRSSPWLSPYGRAAVGAGLDRGIRPRQVGDDAVMARRAYIALGANLGDPAATLRAAVAELGALGTLAAVSSAYVTDPVGPPGQPRYLNAVAAVDTGLAPDALLAALHRIED